MQCNKILVINGNFSRIVSFCWQPLNKVDSNIQNTESIKTFKYIFFHLLTHYFLNAPFLYPLKASENLTVFWCFQWVEKGHIGSQWVKLSLKSTFNCHNLKGLNSCRKKGFF